MPKMNEYNTVEKPLIEWLQDLGWTFVKPEDLEKYRPDLRNPLILPLFREALLKFNAFLTTEAEADKVIDRLKFVINDGDNQEFLAWLRGERSIKLKPDDKPQTVRLLDFENVEANAFIVTNQYRMEGGPAHDVSVRCDIVLLVNGLPLIVIEAKSLTASHKDIREAVKQLNRYQKDFPDLFAPNQFNIGVYELGLKYGATGATRESDYAEWKSSAPHDIPANEATKQAVYGLLDRSNLLDLIQNFIVFEKRGNKTTKKVARYQQFYATNKIVKRVRNGEDKRGLIWHTQGSGKSLTMLFTAWKLRRDPALRNPTVYIVIDRKDLDTQISGTFLACDFPNTARAFSTDDLKKRVLGDTREVVITTIQKFQEFGENGLINDRDNIIVLVDEAHRSQEGDLGSRLQATFKNAFFFGFSGTPIDRSDHNTHRTFGTILADGTMERYLDYYSIKQAIADGATVPVHYVTRLTNWQVNDLVMDEAFNQEFGDLTTEEREQLKKENATNKVLINHPKRVRKIAEDVVNHFRQTIMPNGFKAQLVTFNREACVRYKAVLDLLLGPSASDVIYSPGLNDEDEDMRRYHYSREKQNNLIERFKDPNDPLQFLIVTDMLLTGFDAPIEQVMYLDKPLRDHTLLQAVARTNRPYPNKLNGLIVDYYGVFQNLQKALNFNEDEIEDAVIDFEELRQKFPLQLTELLQMFDGEIRDGSNASLTTCLNRLDDATGKKQANFENGFKRVQLLYETLSPDAFLVPYLDDYDWLCRLVIAYNRRYRRENTLDVSIYGEKTRKLIYQDSSVKEIEKAFPVYQLDENYLIKVDDLLGGVEAKSIEIEQALKKELDLKLGSKPIYESLAARLERLIKARRENTLAAVEQMQQLKLLVSDIVAVGKEASALNLSEGEDANFQLVRKYAPEAVTQERLLAFVRDSDQKIKGLTFAGWQSQGSVAQEIEKELTLLILLNYRELNLYPGKYMTEAMAYVTKYY